MILRLGAVSKEAFAGIGCLAGRQGVLRLSYLALTVAALVQAGCAASTPIRNSQIPKSDTQALQLFQLAQEQIQKNQLVEAEGSLRRALLVQPQAESISYSLGVVLERLNDLSQAGEVFSSLPDSPRKALALRRLRLRSGDRNAISELESEYQAALKLGDFQQAAKIGAALAGVKREVGDLLAADSLMYEIGQF